MWKEFIVNDLGIVLREYFITRVKQFYFDTWIYWKLNLMTYVHG